MNNSFTQSSISKSFFTSDLHFSHKSMCYALSKWERKEENTRKFDTIEEMNQLLLNNINKTVTFNDNLFIVGDVAFTNPTQIKNLLGCINCQNLYLILGNHDGEIRKNQHQLQSMFKFVNNYMRIEVDGQIIILSHYPFRSWHNSGLGSWNLHGHCHGMLEPLKNQLDVGVDNAFKLLNEYKPFSFDEIKQIIKQ